MMMSESVMEVSCCMDARETTSCTSDPKGKELLCSSKEVKSDNASEYSDDDEQDDGSSDDEEAIVLRMLKSQNINFEQLSALIMKAAEEQRKLEDVGRVEGSHDSSSSSLNEFSEIKVEEARADDKEGMSKEMSSSSQDQQELAVQNFEPLPDEDQEEQVHKLQVTQSCGEGMLHQEQCNGNSQLNQSDGLTMSLESPQQHGVRPSDRSHKEPRRENTLGYPAHTSEADDTAINEVDTLIVSKECLNVSKDKTALIKTDKWMQEGYQKSVEEKGSEKKSIKRARNGDCATLLVIGETSSKSTGRSERKISASSSDEPPTKLKKQSHTHTKVSKSSDHHEHQELIKKSIDVMLRNKHYEAAVNEMKTWISDCVEEGTRLAYGGLTADGPEASVECFTSLLRTISRTPRSPSIKHDLAKKILTTIGLNIFLHLVDVGRWNGAHKVYFAMLNRDLDPISGKVLSPNKQASPSKKLLLWALTQINVGKINQAINIVMEYNMVTAEQHFWKLESNACDSEWREKVCMEILNRFNYQSSKEAVRLFQLMVQHQIILNLPGFLLLLDQVLQRLIYHNCYKSACQLVEWAHDAKQWKLSNEITVRMMLIKLLTLVDYDMAPYSHCIRTLMLCPPYYKNLPTQMMGHEESVRLLVNSNWSQPEVNAVLKFFFSMLQEKFSMKALPEMSIHVQDVDADIMPMGMDLHRSSTISRIGVSLSKNCVLGYLRNDSFRLDRESVKKFLLSKGSTAQSTESFSPADAKHQINLPHRKHRDMTRVKSSPLLPTSSTHFVGNQRSAFRR